MKKLTFLLLFTLLPFIGTAQAFDKYEGMKEVDAVVITSKMFKLLTKIDLNADDPETQQYIDLIENLKEMRVFSSKSSYVRDQMAADVASYLKSNSMEELMRVTEGGKTVKFYYKPGKSDEFVSQLFMFMNGKGDEPSVIRTSPGISICHRFPNLPRILIFLPEKNLKISKPIK